MNTSLNQVRKSGKFNSKSTAKGSVEKSQGQDWAQERQERIGQLVKQLEEGVA